MRVLWVSAEPPDSAGGGGNIRQAHLLTAVARRHETRLLLAGRLPDADVRGALAGVTELDPAPPVAPTGRWARRLLDLRLIGPEGPPEHYWGRTARRALRASAQQDADITVVQHAALAAMMPRHRQHPWVLELHNVESETLRALGAVTDGHRQRWLLDRQADRARRFERRWVSSYDGVVVVSDEDAGALPVTPRVVPNGVDVSSWPVSPVPPVPRVVFTGTLGYRPNVDGITWFCRTVWPLVAARCPAARLDVVGRDPVAEVRALGEIAGVRVHADVPDVRPFVTSARICVVPLRFGSGSRLKVLEAWAAGRPVVGTTVGLAGLAVSDGATAVVRDDPQPFADAVVELIGDDGRAQRLGDAGRRSAAEHYDWGRIGAGYASWLADVAASRQ